MERRNRTAGQLLADKGHAVVAVGPDSMVLEALRRLADEDIGAVLVLDGARLVGILSERDYARKCDLLGRSAKDTRVAEIMSTDIVSVGLEHTCEQCMALMHRRLLRHLPVVEAGKVVGLLSSKDLLREMLSEEQHAVRALERDRLQIVGDTGGSY